MAKSFAQIVSAMTSFFSSRRPTVPTGEGSTVRDIIIDAPAQELAKIYGSIDTARQEGSLNTASSIGVSILGNNVGVVRKAAVRAQGVVTFFSRNPITTDIFIPAGTVASTSALNSTVASQFVTTQSVTMFASNSTTYLNTSTGYYEIALNVQALNPGSAGNAGANTVTILASAVAGIDGCYNTGEIVGGVDVEDPELLRLRVAEKSTSSGVGTSDGYLSAVKAIAGVIDATFVGRGQTERDTWGAVDIFIKGSVTRARTDVLTSIGPTIGSIALYKQPVLSDGSITIHSSGSGSVVSSLWTLVKDTGAYGGSVSAQDQIQWVSGSLSSVYGTLVIAYNYNGLVEDVQNLFVQTNKDVQNTSVLVRAARDIAIDITTTVKILPGFDFTMVNTRVQNAVIVLFSSFKIGQEVQQADVARAILNVSGVDDVLLPFTLFQGTGGSIIVNSSNNLELPADGSAVVGTLTFNQAL